MFTRQLFVAAALMAATCAANADVVTTTTTVSTASSLASDMSIVDTSTSLSGADTGLASVMASTNTNSQLVLVRGVEGLYMLAARANGVLDTASAASVTPPAAAAAGDASDIVAAKSTALPLGADALPSVNAAEVPEPASIALMVAGLLGAAGIMRARKQG